MSNRSNKSEPLCMTSEKGEVIFSKEETQRIKTDIARRIIEAFGYQPNSEIAFLLKTTTTTIKSFIEGEEFPPAEILLSIHKITGVSIHWLLTGEGAKNLSLHKEQQLIISKKTEVLELA